MARFRRTHLIPAILILLIAVIAVAALIALAQAVFTPGHSSAPSVDVSKQALLDSTNGELKMRVRGQIVADETFRAYDITISGTNRTFETSGGYNNTPINTISLPNSPAAYIQFAAALDKANFETATPLTGEADNVDGVCSTGTLYEFWIIDAGKTIKHLWTSTCGGSKGSLTTDVDHINHLFVAQIPDANKLLDNIGLLYT